MGVGTSVGGEKIIKSVGMDMVKLEKYQGFSADLSAAFCLLLSTYGACPSTTHTKTSAIMGVGAVKRISHKLQRRARHGAHLGLHLPGLRPYQLPVAKIFISIWSE